MLLTIDIGNTSITLGIFDKKKLVFKDMIQTKATSFPAKCVAGIRRFPHKNKIDGIIISSVVPAALTALEKALKKVYKMRPIVVGRDVKAPIKNLYEQPEQVGQDRLVNAVAACELYGKTRKPIVVIDFGTAVTFDVISKKGEYLGGIIFPGIRLSLETLVKRAALLPKISIKSPKNLVGNNTKDSMRSGILNGYASLCDGITNRIRAIYGKKIKIISTGGDALLISLFSSVLKKNDQDLTLKGLKIIYDKHILYKGVSS